MSDILNDLLEKETKEDKEQPLGVLKELFMLKEIESKSELNAQQVVLINQKRTISRLLDWDELDSALNDFMLLQVSKNRAGRSEFVDAFKANRDSEQNINPSFWGNFKNRIGL